MKKSIVCLLFFFAAVAVVAAPVPYGALGYYKTVDMTGGGTTNWVNWNSTSTGGGVFDGTLSGISTQFWCVDSQHTFTTDAKKANAVRIADITTPTDTTVQYGTITTEGATAGKWNEVLGITDAKSRYAMAAWLVSNYVTSPTTITTSAGPGNDKNDAIQAAIWTIMSTDGTKQFAGSTFGAESTATWITNAKNNYTKVDLTEWAVVSWESLNASGTLGTTKYQTFLVQVVPEPGFYGVLALGLSGLVLVLKRRKA